MCLLHGVLRQKDKFGGFGWAMKNYDFSATHFVVTMQHFRKVIANQREAQNIPIDLLHHLVVDMNYSSEVKNFYDSMNLYELASTFFKPAMFEYGPGGQAPADYDITGSACQSLMDERQLQRLS